MDRIKLLTLKPDPTWEESREWMLGLMRDLKLIYHPDNPSNTYINMDTKKPTFTDEECEALDNSTDILFNKFKQDIYKIGVEAQHQYEDLKKK